MQITVAVIGPSRAKDNELEFAEALGKLIAQEGWVVVTGGKGGVMEAASKGARAGKGISIGILPESSRDFANKYVDIAIPTGIGEARNFIVINSADAIVAVGYSTGTLIEMASASRAGKLLLGYNVPKVPEVNYTTISSPVEAIEKIKNYLGGKND